MTTKTIAAPVADPHPPTRLQLPAGATDAHCHVFGPGDVFPYAPERAYTPPDAPYERLVGLHDRMGLTNGVIVQASCHGTDNAALLDALRRGEGRYAGVAMVSPEVTRAELEELHEAGVRSTRFNFVAHLGGRPDLDAFRTVVEKVVPLGWHLVLHFDAKDIADNLDLLRGLPCPWIIDHMGRVDTAAGVDQPAFAALLELMADERCWVKISGAERLTVDGTPPYDDVVPFARALVEAAPDRVLWGTDWPHPNVRSMPDDGDLVDLLADLLPGEADRQRVLVDNPRTLYPLS
ncbi:amidohydrolase family protein [Enemella evansiae]|uniref:amidohydrolase family protein n=1 Tax=Enemella evansiae TaxID=2016499 RepID=UPI001E3906B8|nr:amidohydrolase family protein [Enemella evansiae]